MFSVVIPRQSDAVLQLFVVEISVYLLLGRHFDYLVRTYLLAICPYLHSINEEETISFSQFEICT